MKNHFILLLFLISSVSTYANITLEELEIARDNYQQALKSNQTIKSEHSDAISQLEAQKALLQEQLELNNSEYAELKPKSIKAKKSSKQITKIEEDISSISAQIERMQQEITESNQSLEGAKFHFDNLRQQYEAEQLENETILDETSSIEQNDEIEEPETEIINDTTTSSNESEEDDDPVGTILFAVGVVIFFYIIGLITRERCPHCGKKGKLKSLGDTRKYQYDEKGNVTRTGVLKRYKCSHCGQYVEKIKWS